MCADQDSTKKIYPSGTGLYPNSQQKKMYFFLKIVQISCRTQWQM